MTRMTFDFSRYSLPTVPGRSSSAHLSGTLAGSEQLIATSLNSTLRPQMPLTHFRCQDISKMFKRARKPRLMVRNRGQKDTAERLGLSGLSVFPDPRSPAGSSERWRTPASTIG